LRRKQEMPKILVVYYSRTKNTEKMAFAVAEAAKKVSNIEVNVKKVEQASLEDLLNADGIIMGSPVYYGSMAGKLKTFIDESVKYHGKLEGKVGAAFTSSGGTATGAETTLLSILQTMLVHGMVVQGCSDNKHYGAAAVGAPKEEDLEYCRNLGKRVANLVIKLEK
jgi:NAD(P)H dehydrogenase (quinone)